MTPSHREELIQALPYARRYARALTGSQQAGDRLVADSLRAMMEQGAEGDPRHALYRAVTERSGGGAERIDGMSGVQRQLLLLTALEELAPDDAAAIVGIAPA